MHFLTIFDDRTLHLLSPLRLGLDAYTTTGLVRVDWNRKLSSKFYATVSSPVRCARLPEIYPTRQTGQRWYHATSTFYLFSDILRFSAIFILQCALLKIN
jgi:hypothetical protein